MRIEHHPKLNVWVREDGCVYLPQSGTNKAHWTFGSISPTDGYRRVGVQGHLYPVHRLVAECYIVNQENKPFVDHINRNKIDNRVENLRWVTKSENSRNTEQHDRVDARGGTHKYEDKKQFNNERSRAWCKNNPEKVKSIQKKYLKTHKLMRFSDGHCHRVSIDEYERLVGLQVKERVYEN